MSSHIKEEIKRKFFHLLSMIYIAGYWILPRDTALLAMGIIIFLALVIESARLKYEKINKLILMLGVHRKSEEHRFSGLLWTLSGAFFTIYFFDDPARSITKNIVLASLLYAALGDTAAAIYGTWLGKIKIGNKSLEGSIACFIVNLIVGYFLIPWPVFLWAAVLSTFFEAIQWPLNDNFWLPVLSAGALTQLMIRYAFL